MDHNYKIFMKILKSLRAIFFYFVKETLTPVSKFLSICLFLFIKEKLPGGESFDGIPGGGTVSEN